MEVKNYWIRILILVSYILVLFVVSRFIDLVLWYQHGYLPNHLVDPLVLNVRQLKFILDSRGISYTGILEKQQLVQLLNDSAHLVKSEVDDVNLSSNTTERMSSHAPPSSMFTGGSHFNEKVEDTKDSVWLVQVLPACKQHHEPLLDDYSWKYLKHHLAPFAIQTGVFDCAADKELCIKKNWLEPILLLALPRGNRPKDHVIIRTSNTPKIHMIIKWVKEQLSTRVNRISSLSELDEEWITPKDSNQQSDIKVVLFTHLLHTPLFFAALSIKFTGRIKFGIFNVKKDEADQVNRYLSKHGQNKLSKTGSPGSSSKYLVISPEKVHDYGHLYAEHFNVFYMNIFLKLIQPEMNDVFIAALLITNMLATIDICQIRGNTKWLFVMRGLYIFISYNLLLFITSLVIYNLSWSDSATSLLAHFTSILRYINFSSLGALLRWDAIQLYKHPTLFMVSFVLYGFLISKFVRTDNNQSNWYDIFGDSYLVNYLFQRSRHLPVPLIYDINDMTNFDLRFEQLLISRSPHVFNVPNLWLQPSPRVDYISDLPVFEFKGWKECSHKNMELIEQVMDGASPSVLHTNNESPAACDYLQCRLFHVQECSICLECYELKTVLLALPCAHHFHKSCVMSWLKRGNSQCPVCRWPAYKQKYEFNF